MYCPRCGQQQISDEMKFCSRCGLPMSGLAEWLTLAAAKGDPPGSKIDVLKRRTVSCFPGVQSCYR